MSTDELIKFGVVLTWIVLILACARFGVSLYRILKARAGVNELAIGLISVLVVTTLIWILLDPNEPLLKTGIATRLLLLLIYGKLLFIPRQRNGIHSK